MNYNEILAAAKDQVGPYCKACPVCNGKACGNNIPGPGSKGIGDTAMRNYAKWQDIRVHMDTISDVTAPDASLELFGKKFRFPFFAGPVGAVVFIIVFVVGHTLNIAINLLGSFVHTSRLQYLEFFGKFYEDGGKAFAPLDLSTKYADLKQD